MRITSDSPDFTIAAVGDNTETSGDNHHNAHDNKITGRSSRGGKTQRITVSNGSRAVEVCGVEHSDKASCRYKYRTQQLTITSRGGT